MSKDIYQNSWKFAPSNKQTKHMTSKKKLFYALFFASSFSFGQSSSDQLKELINSALERWTVPAAKSGTAICGYRPKEINRYFPSESGADRKSRLYGHTNKLHFARVWYSTGSTSVSRDDGALAE